MIQDDEDKFSKQDPMLQSQRWGFEATVILFPIIMDALFIPFAIIGSIFKAFSYLDPKVKEVNNTVKERLTPKNLEISNSDQTPIQTLLHDTLMSGQKTGALIIKANPELTLMSEDILKLIKKLNPAKVVLEGDWNSNNFNIKPYLVDSTTSSTRKMTWDISALEPVKPQQDPFDYTTSKSPNIVYSVNEALNKHSIFGSRHTIYVVPTDNKTAQMRSA